jgi:hypothetical protein
MSADVEEVKAELYGKLESLYSAVNRLRFYRELAMLEEAEALEKKQSNSSGKSSP